MTNTIKKIFDVFKNRVVLSVLESYKHYIVCVCNNADEVDSTTGSLFALDKKTFKATEFSYFVNPSEYAEACKHVLYRSKYLK